MSPPTSTLFEVQDIPNAGRGVIATQRIPAGTFVLDSQLPAAHVILREYRKEVCAYCFNYDRGRTLPVRDNEIGKVFCSSECQTTWVDSEGQLGVKAWREIHKYVQSKGKAIIDVASIVPTGDKPGLEAIASTWQKAEEQAHSGSNSKKGSRKTPPNQGVDPDILGLFLSGIIYHHDQQEKWQNEVLSLAMNDQPYKSTLDLETHANSLTQLAALIPSELLPSLTAGVCQTLIHAGSHNAFGIRSGSDDGEEYMGYALYPAASYFNHSCSPNINKKRSGRTWAFSAARDIEVGEQCCITYLGGDEKDMTVSERRSRLGDNWGFPCACVRCVAEHPPTTTS